MPIRECNSHLWLTIGVPNRPPSKKSIWCQKFVDNMGSGGGAGTLRWGPQAPKSLVHRAKGGSLRVKLTKNGKITTFF